MIGLVLGIIVVVAVIGVLFFLPENRPGIFVQEFSTQMHSDLNTQIDIVRELEASLIEAESAFEDRSTEDWEEFQLSKALTVSFRKELEWIAQREGPAYSELSLTQNNVRAKELLEQEAALFSVFVTTVQLNDFVVQKIQLEDKDVTLESIDVIVRDLNASDAFSRDTAKAIAGETGLDADAIQNTTTGFLQDFFDYKKSVFSNAPMDSIEQFVEAYKLASWYFTLESVKSASTVS